MDKINRAVVKAQAKQLIKGKWIYLAVISLIVSLLTVNSFSIFVSKDYFSDAFKDGFDKGFSQGFESDNDDVSDFESFGELSDFESFGAPNQDFNFDDFMNDIEDNQDKTPSKSQQIASRLSTPMNILNIVMAPLIVTLAGIYLAFIRRNPEEEFQLGKELGGLFKNSFNETYVKKLVLVILRGLFTALLCCLFVIPGIVYYYSTYFAFQILSDNPDMKPSEAAKLSRKMVKGNRGELFLMNLSFIGWFILVGITCGIALVYVVPYFQTTDALYYENFRMRALQVGRISINDFKQPQQNAQENNAEQDTYFSYANPNSNTDYYYNPQPTNPAEAEQSEMYYSAPEPQENEQIEEISISPNDIENIADNSQNPADEI